LKHPPAKELGLVAHLKRKKKTIPPQTSGSPQPIFIKQIVTTPLMIKPSVEAEKRIAPKVCREPASQEIGKLLSNL
jgi:Na+-transporting NADH:ubiquinone oxidoreductase subunit NqrA